MSDGPLTKAADAMRRLVASVAGTEPILDEHLNDYDEVLSHLLMAELGRWFVRAVAAGDHRGVADFLAAVELLYSSEDSITRNVAEVSFMEWLTQAPDANERAAIEAIRHLAGPKTLADLVYEETIRVAPPDAR